jgi:hypothetical protein
MHEEMRNRKNQSTGQNETFSNLLNPIVNYLI